MIQSWVDVGELTGTLRGSAPSGQFQRCDPRLSPSCSTSVDRMSPIFGMKDYQQAVVLKRMTRSWGNPIKYVIAPDDA